MRWKDVGKGIVLCLAVMLVGCSPYHTPPSSQYCNLLKLQAKLASDLESEGIQVIQVGEETTLVLPADKFFYLHSNHMYSHSESYLYQIIRFINTYPVVDVQVFGYTDNIGDYTRNLALSRSQAQSIAGFLWQNGLNARMLTAVGMACHNDVASNLTRHGNAKNRRIEIHFRLPPPNNVFH